MTAVSRRTRERQVRHERFRAFAERLMADLGFIDGPARGGSAVREGTE